MCTIASFTPANSTRSAHSHPHLCFSVCSCTLQSHPSARQPSTYPKIAAVIYLVIIPTSAHVIKRSQHTKRNPSQHPYPPTPHPHESYTAPKGRGPNLSSAGRRVLRAPSAASRATAAAEEETAGVCGHSSGSHCHLHSRGVSPPQSQRGSCNLVKLSTEALEMLSSWTFSATGAASPSLVFPEHWDHSLQLTTYLTDKEHTAHNYWCIFNYRISSHTPHICSMR